SSQVIPAATRKHRAETVGNRSPRPRTDRHATLFSPTDTRDGAPLDIRDRSDGLLRWMGRRWRPRGGQGIGPRRRARGGRGGRAAGELVQVAREFKRRISDPTPVTLAGTPVSATTALASEPRSSTPSLAFSVIPGR